MSSTFAILGRPIGDSAPCYVIAELSANHGGDLAQARELVRAAARAGADAVKLQTYTPDTITLDCRNDHFRIDEGTLWDGRVLYDLYAEAQTPWKWYADLAELASELGMHCFSSAFDASAVAFLEQHGAPAHKVASFELVDIPLLRCIGATAKPVIVSTGMATLDEIDEAVATLRDAGAGPIALLRTNSGYPADPAEMDLRAIPALAERYGVVVGLSDHTLGIGVAVAAVALGARIVEKHVTLSRDVPGPDSAFSLEPAELAELVEAVRISQSALGRARFGPTQREKASLPFRRSLFVVQNLRAGDRFSADNVRSIRPAAGLHTRHLGEVIGRRAARDIERGTPLSWDLIHEED